MSEPSPSHSTFSCFSNTRSSDGRTVAHAQATYQVQVTSLMFPMDMSLDERAPPFCDFFQRKPHLRACAWTPRSMSTVKDSIAAATSIVETKGCIRKNWATLSRTGKTLWRTVQRAVVCVKAQVKHGVPCHNHSL